MSPHVHPDYISVGCNRFSNICDTDGASQVAFGAGRCVALWNTAVSRLPSLLILTHNLSKILPLGRNDKRDIPNASFAYLSNLLSQIPYSGRSSFPKRGDSYRRRSRNYQDMDFFIYLSCSECWSRKCRRRPYTGVCRCSIG